MATTGTGSSPAATESHRAACASKLVTYYFRGETRLGVWAAGGVIDLHRAYREVLRERGESRPDARAQALVPPNMLAFLGGEDESIAAAKQAIDWVRSKKDAGRKETALNHLKDLGVWFEHSEIRLGPPIPRPPHLLAMAFNFRPHSGEINVAIPQFPNVFTKEGRVIGPDEAIEIPDQVEQTDYEGELAVVIGKRARAVRRESAYEFIAGYTVFNDVTSRDYQFRVSQYTLGKSIDTYSAMGPYLVLKDGIPDPHQLRILTRIGDEVLQDSNTSNMIFTIPEIVAYVSQLMELDPGTVIATDTPSGVGAGRKPPRFLRPGDTIVVEVEDLGVLENKVVRAGFCSAKRTNW